MSICDVTHSHVVCDVMYYRSHKHHASPQADFLEKNFQFPLIFLEFDSFPRWNYTFGLVPYLSVLNFPWPPLWACDVTRNHMMVWHRSCHAHCTQNNLLPTCWKKTSLPVINLSWKFVARNHCEVLLYRITHHIFPNVLCDETAMMKQKRKMTPSCTYSLPLILNGRSGIQRYKHDCAVERCSRIMFFFSSHLCY